jgi:hypothetical protein
MIIIWFENGNQNVSLFPLFDATYYKLNLLFKENLPFR